MLTIAQAVREALKVTDPEGPRDRILTIARAKLAQSGSKEEVKLHNVYQGVEKIRKAMNTRVLTKELVAEYETKFGRLLRKTVGTPIVPPHKRTLPTITPPEVKATVPTAHNELRQAVAFAKEVGGIERAIEVLQELKEFQISSTKTTNISPSNNGKT